MANPEIVPLTPRQRAVLETLDENDEYELSPARTPEQYDAAALAGAIVLQALDDLRKNQTTSGDDIEAEYQSARKFFFDDNSEESSFRWCCDQLGWSITRARKMIQEWQEKGCPFTGDVLRTGRGRIGKKHKKKETLH